MPVSCPDCGATRNDLQSLGWSDDGDVNNVSCQKCATTFDVDHTGDEPTIVGAVDVDAIQQERDALEAENAELRERIEELKHSRSDNGGEN